MDAREQLLYLLEHYNKGNYSTDTFADEFSRIYNLETDYKKLSEVENRLMYELSLITDRFSPVEEDFEKYPNVYYNEDDVKTKATQVYLDIIKSHKS